MCPVYSYKRPNKQQEAKTNASNINLYFIILKNPEIKELKNIAPFLQGLKFASNCRGATQLCFIGRPH